MTRLILTEYYKSVLERVDDLLWHYKNMSVIKNDKLVKELDKEVKELQDLILLREQREEK